MRKAIIGACLVFGLSFAFGMTTAEPAKAAGFCTYRCVCSVPYKCCGSACKVTNEIQCPQVFDC